MSEVKVNKISPRSGTTVTLGDSGDTFTLASGVSLTGVNATFSGDLTVDTDTLYVDSSNNRVGVGTTSPSVTFDAEADGATVAHFNRATSDGDIIELQKDGTTVGSIGYTSIGFYIDGESAHSGIRFGASQYVPKVNGSDSDNGVSLGTAVARFKDLYLGGNIYLGGTGSANALDDYEEGTWTPAYEAGIAAFTSITHDVQQGTYIKVGKKVTVWFRVRTDSVSGGSGTVYVGGLPFTSDSSGGTARVDFAIGTCYGNSWTGTYPTNIIIPLAETKGALIYQPTNADAGNVDVINMQAGTNDNLTVGCVTYYTAF